MTIPSRDRKAGAHTLRPGHNELGNGHVERIQRARMVAAMLSVACEHGAANATVGRVVERAGVSRRTFYEIFEDVQGCFLAALDEAVAQVSRHVLDAYDPGQPWRTRMREALLALLGFLEDRPEMARVIVVESLGAGPQAMERREGALRHVTAAVDGGRDERKTGEGPGPLTAEGVVGAVMSVLHARIVEGSGGSLLDLSNPLMSMIVLPYLGPAAARRELDRAVPARVPRRAAPASGSPLRDMPMRLTYRTIRVLRAVAEQPRASNRQIGAAAGIEDQGQISKLLARLARIGLIANARDQTLRGAPNAWRLTDQGERLAQAIGGADDQERWYGAARDGG